MALIKISEYRENHFVHGSRPCLKTIRKWIKNKDVYGVKIDGRYYVDPDVIILVSPLVLKVLLNTQSTFLMKRKKSNVDTGSFTGRTNQDFSEFNEKHES